MGCVCSKENESSDHDQPQLVKSRRKLASSSRTDESLESGTNEVSNSDGGRERLISSNSEENNVVVPTSVLLNEADKEFEVVERIHRRRRAVVSENKLEVANVRNSVGVRLPGVPNGFVGEHVAAGWPAWLTTVAGEAVKGWLPRRADSFEKLNKIGQGTYSSVYKARDLETGKIVALKKVRFANMDPESVRFMAREIYILRRLNHQNVVKLEGLVASRMSCSLYLVFEYMEHDLTGLAATPGLKFTEPQIKCYMQQLLSGLHHCHSRGVLHRDIKGSNLLIDNKGILKLADFGLATFFNPDQKQPLTSRVVTLWYRPPELLLGATEYGVSVDLWSTGCILAELFAGKPIMPGRTEVEQLHKIFKLCGSPSEEFWMKLKLPHATIFKPQHAYQRRVSNIFRDFPPSSLALLERLLAIEPASRGTADAALKSEFFTTQPLPCHPSSLPKYPPSKELDAKLRDEEARRQRAAAVKGDVSSGREGEAGPNANVDSQRRIQANPKIISEKYNQQGNGGTRFHIDPPGKIAEDGFMYPGVSNTLWSKKFKDEEKLPVPSRSSAILERSRAPELRKQMSHVPHAGNVGVSNLSGPLSSRNNSIKWDDYKEIPKHAYWAEHTSSTRYSQLGAANTSTTHSMAEKTSTSQKKIESLESKDSTTTGFSPNKNMIHYSGPLMPPGGNLDEILKEHERQIQQAVRRAQIDKVKNKGQGDTGLSDSLLFTGRNGRSNA